MFQKLAKMSIIASAVTLQSFNGNDLAHFIILFQNSGSADFTDWLWVNITQKLNDYQDGAKTWCYCIVQYMLLDSTGEEE